MPRHTTLISALLAAALLVGGCKSSPGDNGSGSENNEQANNQSDDTSSEEDEAQLGDDYAPPFYDADPTVDQPEDNPDFEEHPKLSQIQLPPGFQIRMYAEVPNARSLELADDGTLFVGNRNSSKAFAIRDTNGDMKGDEQITLTNVMRMPNGVALHGGDLYIAEVSKVWKLPDILENLPEVPPKELVNDDFPTDRHHGWKYIALAPTGSSTCRSARRAISAKRTTTSTRISCGWIPTVRTWRCTPRVFATRSASTGIPDTGNLWFTDNGRDMMGDNRPPDELNRVTEAGQHFGYPYCHGGFVADPEFGDEKSCDEFVPPVQNLGPHVAALGMEFYEGEMFPEEYHKQIFIAEHGSWNRSEKIGYRVMLVRLNEQNEAVSYEVFAKGWLQGESSWGRPVDVEVMKDGSLLVSDDGAGAVYRIVYTGEDG